MRECLLPFQEGSDFLAKICFDWEKEALAAAKSGVRLVLLMNEVLLFSHSDYLKKRERR